MLNDQYKREMEQFGPRQEELEKLCTLIEGGTDMKWKKWLGRKAVVAIAACAALTLTAAAAAPTVWEALRAQQGPFAPYTQTIEGAKCTDEGIEIQVLSAISDDLAARFYLAVRDVEEDRLNECLTLTGTLTAGENKEELPLAYSGGYSTRHFELLSYDSESRTALFSTQINYQDVARPNGKARLEITGMTTRKAQILEDASCGTVTGAELKSLGAGEDDTVVHSPSSVDGIGYTDDILPDEQVVLAPGQNPVDIEGTEDMRISSMGFASDGRFHIRLEFAEGVKPATFEPVNMDSETGVNLCAGQVRALLYCDLMNGDGDMRYYVCQARLVEGGMDILFPLLTAEDLEEIQSRRARISGTYIRPGMDLEGDWATEFEVEYYESTVLDWTGELEGWQVEQVTVSPLNVTIKRHSGDKQGAFGPGVMLYAVKQDGSTVAAEPGPSGYTNEGALAGESEDRWEAFETWRFEEPLDLDEIVSLKLMDTEIPIK